MTKLTKKQSVELQRLTDEIMSLATEVVEDYKRTPSEMSGSLTQIHMNSSILDGGDENNAD